MRGIVLNSGSYCGITSPPHGHLHFTGIAFLAADSLAPRALPHLRSTYQNDSAVSLRNDRHEVRTSGGVQLPARSLLRQVACFDCWEWTG